VVAPPSITAIILPGITLTDTLSTDDNEDLCYDDDDDSDDDDDNDTDDDDDDNDDDDNDDYNDDNEDLVSITVNMKVYRLPTARLFGGRVKVSNCLDVSSLMMMFT
jgi:ABC-type Zn2+ transport system substrate-binding protein/surface adhesin